MTKPDTEAFKAAIAAEGYEPVEKSMEPACALDDHTHPFHVKALVTEGVISITVGGRTTRYGPGDQFTMAAGCVHSEVVGPDGVTFISGRKED
jgi:quercetin dioxygenase-like cupin family protein